MRAAPRLSRPASQVRLLVPQLPLEVGTSSRGDEEGARLKVGERRSGDYAASPMLVQHTVCTHLGALALMHLLPLLPHLDLLPVRRSPQIAP